MRSRTLHAELETLLGPLPRPLAADDPASAGRPFPAAPTCRAPARPPPSRGLWLAGDYTYGDYPATIGKQRSGAAPSPLTESLAAG